MVTLSVTKTSEFDGAIHLDRYYISTDSPVNLFHNNGIIYDALVGKMKDFDEVMGFLRYMRENTSDPSEITIRFCSMPRFDPREIFGVGELDKGDITNRLKRYL